MRSARALVLATLSAVVGAVVACNETVPSEPRSPIVAVAGLSKLEVPPDVPHLVTLRPNPALVDGDVTVSAGLDLGWAESAGSDTASRDVGAVFPSVTAVDTVHVLVDRALPAPIAAAISWTAWWSDDNVSWLPVAIAGPVAFQSSAAEPGRFEIPVARTEARYLKVTARPLAAGVTTDPQSADLFVTEVRFYLAGAPVSSAAAVPGPG